MPARSATFARTAVLLLSVATVADAGVTHILDPCPPNGADGTVLSWPCPKATKLSGTCYSPGDTWKKSLAQGTLHKGCKVMRRCQPNTTSGANKSGLNCPAAAGSCLPPVMPNGACACTLLSTGFGKFIQVLLGFVGFSVLLVKRQRERPQRPWNIWGYDSAKQAFGAGVAHFSGIICSLVIGGEGGHYQCGTYFIIYLFDTTLGVSVALYLLKLTTQFAEQQQWSSLVNTGNYGSPPDAGIWAKQMLSWCVLTIVARVVCCLTVVTINTAGVVSWLAAALSNPLQCCPNVLLVIVMIGCPVGMNGIQFWVQDHFLKAHDDKDELMTGGASDSAGVAYAEESSEPRV